MAADLFDVDEFLAGIKPRTAVAKISVRQDLISKHAELEEQLEQALRDDRALNREPVAPDIAAQITELETKLEQSHVEFRFKSIGARAWQDLLAQHPPTRDQRQATPTLDHNPDTFPPAAVAASSDEPKLVVAQARALVSQLDLVNWQRLWAAALDANIGGDTNPKSGTAGLILQQKERSETTAANEGSPDQSSLDG